MRLPRKREQVLRTISSRIEAGIYSTGERIPTEPMLAKEFGVARETLRGALEILEKRGLIQRFPGEGTYVRRREEGARELYLLIPCPDYFVISDYQTRTTLREILCGCLTEANRRNAHVVTLPITKERKLVSSMVKGCAPSMTYLSVVKYLQVAKRVSTAASSFLGS